jgi:hypothetical protein
MKTTRSITCLALTTIALTISGFGTIRSSATQTGELRFRAPSEWVKEKPSSNVRLAQYKLPKADGDNEDASLVLYFFGSNQGGSVQANLERWTNQIAQPGDSSTRSRAKTETFTINELKVTTIDLSGTYVAETAPGSNERHNDPDYRLRAAVIETPKGPHYVKLVGPAKTVGRWEKAFDSYLQSFEFK